MKSCLLRNIVITLLLLICFLFSGCAHKHEFGSWKTDVEPSCTETGIQHRSCIKKNCEETETQVLPALGHSSEKKEIRTEPACTEDGEICLICTRCKETVHSEVLEAVGHTPGSWTTVREADCTENGKKVKICKVCGEACETETIPASGHSGEWVTVREMNENQTGLRRFECTVCGQTEEEEIPIVLSFGLSEAVNKGIAGAEVTMSGINSGSIRVKNLTQHPLKLSIPAGTYLVSGSKSNQNMLVTGSSVHELDGGEEKEIWLDTACMNIHRNIPGAGDSYSVGFTDNRTLQRLVELFEDNHSGYAVRQAAVWIVTDNASYSDTGVLVSNNSRYISESDYNEASRLVELARRE